jgi:hypothetical protein
MSDYYLQYLEAIDEGDQEVTAWEAQFIEDMLTQRPQQISEKQQGVIRRMAARYLGETIE